MHRYTHPDGRIGGEFIKAVKDRGAKARLLLIDRNCRAAEERISIESPKDYDKGNRNTINKAILFKDNAAVENFYRKEDFFDGKVQLRFYNTPYAGVVIFRDLIFVEIYHLGHDGEGSGRKNNMRPCAGIGN